MAILMQWTTNTYHPKTTKTAKSKSQGRKTQGEKLIRQISQADMKFKKIRQAQIKQAEMKL